MAYKVFANGNPLQASELNENLMQQAIAVFADATARDAAITAPVNGQFAYLTGTSNLTKYTGAAWEDAIAVAPTAVQEKASNYTLLASDAGSYIYVTAAATITIADVLAVGETVNIISTTAGAVDFAAGAGVTLYSKDSLVALTGQYSGASVTKKATGDYYIIGDLA
ncbi:MAG: hypothetical protein K0U52_11690 [Gammaproteobacteria bacterium]|nr:hypothetical protein [Gammaproteobacteria bacterium]